MKERNLHTPWGRLALVAALALGGLSSLAAAQSGPRPILGFSGNDGDTPGSNIITAPVYSPADGRLYGFTAGGGESYQYLASFGAVSVPSGRGFSVAPDGSDYASWSLGGAGGWSLTNVVLDAQGRAVTASQNTLRDDSGQPTLASLRVVGVAEDGLVWFDRPSDAIANVSTNVSPRGMLAADDKGNVYFGMGASQVCNATNPDRSLYRRTPDGAIESVVNFCDFTETRGSARSFLKGGAPFINFYSTRDQALYILSMLAAQNGADIYPDIVSGSDRVLGFLVRIGQEALERGNVTADDIEVLRAFKQSETNGVIGLANDGGHSALVEDGDWLYGTGTAILWRVNKTDPANSFAVVHTFPAASSVVEPTNENAGVEPAGGLARGRDGNLYGVTRLDATQVGTNGRAAGAGSLYRVVVGSEPDRSDDRIEFLHYFDAETEGSSPRGVSAGPAANGVQTLYGAVSGGLQGSGGLFSYEIPVPQVAITAFTASETSAVAGDTVRLDWASENAVACTASGDNGGVWEGAQQTSASGVPVTLTQEGDNTFVLECQDDAGESVSASVTVTVTAASEPPPDGDGDGDGNGGGNGDDDDGGGSGGPVGPAALLMLAGFALSRRALRGVLI